MEELKVVTLPFDFPPTETGMPFPHMVLNGEVVQTCNMYIQNIREKVGKKVICSQCGRQFDVVKEVVTVKAEEPK